MAAAAKTFRVFVSSTFNDLKAERNALQAYVFPRLRELCEEHGAQFQPIDLRWGVSDEASLDQQAMSICLDEIERCKTISPRPNFIVLLGDRYGWLPPLSNILQKEFQQIVEVISEADKRFLKEWYRLDNNAQPPEYRLKPRQKGGPYEEYQDWQPIETRLHAVLSSAVEEASFPEDRKLPYQASATHQEILAGALEQKDAPEHIFCFTRYIQNLPRRFDFLTFQRVLSGRVEQTYPQGLPPKSQAFIQDLQAMPPDSSARDVHDYVRIKLAAVPQATLEEEVLKWIAQALTDFLGKDYLNYDQRTWAIDQDAYQRLKGLKKRLEETFSSNLFRADQVEWQGGNPPAGAEPYRCLTEDHIGKLPAHLEDCQRMLEEGYHPQNLCEAAFQHLGQVILAEVGRQAQFSVAPEPMEHFLVDKALDDEGWGHLAFAEERIKNFVGREEILANLEEHIRSNQRRMLVIAGEGGSGKSSLMAKALQKVQNTCPEHEIVFRFIGATPSSSDGRSLLESVCREIARRYGKDEDGIPVGYLDLVPEFGRQLRSASADRPLILFLDSLDQLAENQGARSLNWLPGGLPEHVSLILSTRVAENTYDNLLPKDPIIQDLGGLSEQDGKLLLREWLGEVQRTLQKEQEQEVLQKFMASKGNPLYLKLAFEEARLWTSYQPLEEVAVGVSGIIRKNMLNRLEQEGNHGPILVSKALGYLAASRYGVAEDELVDLLSRDFEVYEWFFKQSYHLPPDLIQLARSYLKEHPELGQKIQRKSNLQGDRLAAAWLKQDRTPPEPVMTFLQQVLKQENGPQLPIVLWSRLSFDLEPYLTGRMVDGYALLDFYHRELGDVSEEVFLGDDQAQAFHAKLADYFLFKADPEGDGTWQGNHPHGLSELPYHLTKAGQRDMVFNILTDFTFLEQKAENVGITERVDESGRKQITSDGVLQLQQDYERALETLYGGGGSASQVAPLILTAQKVDGRLMIYCPVCNQNSQIDRKILGREITCPQTECDASLKINKFIINMD
jgi:hypothetical protein